MCNKSRDFHPEKGEKVSISLFPHMLLLPSIISPPFPHVYDACFDLGRKVQLLARLLMGKTRKKGEEEKKMIGSNFVMFSLSLSFSSRQENRGGKENSCVVC